MADESPSLPNTDNSIIAAGVQSPEIDPKTLDVTQPAIRDSVQGWTVFEALRDSNRTRNDINSSIVSRYNRKQPRELSTDDSWKANFSTAFLFGIVNRAIPAFTQYIEGLPNLTQARLKGDDEESTAKTEFYREKFTKVVRSWKGFRSYCSSLAKELVLIGYASGAHTDEYEWRPTFYRGDKLFLAEGSSEFPDYLQIFGIEQPILVHELTKIIKKREAAEAAGWNIENAVESINAALPERDSEGTDQTNPRTYEQAIIEGNLGKSHETGVKVIKLCHLFAVEADGGKVTHIILDGNGGHKELLWYENRFESMAEVISMFTLDPPDDGKYYGAVGLARILVNIAHALDMTVNDAVDNLRLAGIMVLNWDKGKGLPSPVIRSPFLLADPEMLPKNQPGFQANVQAFVALIDELKTIAEIAAQQYIPNTLTPDEGKDKTATEASIDRSRELQAHSATIARFAGQFANSMYPIQMRLGNLETNDEEAKEFQKALKEEGKFNDKEIEEISQSTPSEVLQDLTKQENAIISQAGAQYIGNPMVDQKKLLEMKMTAELGVTRTKELILPNGLDPNDEGGNIRQQIMETESILNGAPGIPAIPMDNDMVHLKVLIPDLAKGLQAVSQNPQAVMADPSHLDHLNAGIVHGDAHVTNWKNKGAKPEETKPYEDALKKLTDALHKIGQELVKQKGKLQQQQTQPPQPQQAPQPEAKPEQTYGGLTERIVVAIWGQYANLAAPEKERLEEISGLRKPGEVLPGEHQMATDPMPLPPGQVPPEEGEQPQVPLPPYQPPQAPQPPPPESPAENAQDIGPETSVENANENPGIQ